MGGNIADLTYLVNPSERNILEHAGDRMPLGLLYIAKELDKHKHSVRVFDLNHTHELELFMRINQEKPTMIGVSCYTSPMLNESKRLLKEIREHTDARLIVGGYHPTVMPDDFRGLVDNVVVGEGEYAAECLVNDINGFIKRGAPANLEGLGKPARYFLDYKDYNMKMGGKRTGTIITSRGCPNSCVFCGNMNKKVRYHRVEDIADELVELNSRGYSAVYFLDDVFTINRERSKFIGGVCKQLNMPFRVTTRANYLDSQRIGDLARNGCDIASLGVESGNSGVLERVGKGQTKEQIRACVKELGMQGIKSKGFFIIGLPGDTEDTVKETLDFAVELKGYGMIQQDFYPLTPFPGTVIWKNPESYGLKIIDRDYSNYLQASKDGPRVVCETEGLKADRIKQILIETRCS